MKTLIINARLGDDKSMEQLIQMNEGLIHSVITRFLNRGLSYDDLYQLGCIGMIKAVKRFDLSHNVYFSTYAVPLMVGEIKQFLRDNNIIKISRKWKVLASKIESIRNETRNKTGKELSVTELSDLLNISPDDLMLAMDACCYPESFERIIESKKTVPFDDPIDRIVLEDALKKLNDFEYKLISLRYYSSKSQKEIGNILGVSQAQISRMEKKILTKLREFL